jgi:hypothetical protein
MSLLTSIVLAAAPAPGAEDIRDIHAPFAIGEWWRWPLALAAGAVAALAVVLVVRYVQKRRARPLTPREQALAALRLAETLAREGRSREWADLVAETLRSALSTRLGAEILPRTTSELAEIWATPPLVDAPRVLELLETCDLARFAKASLDDRALLAQTVLARALVEHLFTPFSSSPQPAAVTP